MNAKLLIAGSMFAIACGYTAQTAIAGSGCQQTHRLADLLLNRSHANAGSSASSADTPEPATYADHGLTLGGGGGVETAAPRNAAAREQTPVERGREAPTSIPSLSPGLDAGPRTAPWRALLPGSIQ